MCLKASHRRIYNIYIFVELGTVPYVNNGPLIYIGKIMNFQKFYKKNPCKFSLFLYLVDVLFDVFFFSSNRKIQN